MEDRLHDSVIIDTGFIYALYFKKDISHQKAKEAAIKYGKLKWLTSCFVFQELFWLMRESHLSQIFEAEQKEIFHVVDFERNQLRSLELFIKKYSDRQIDLADASLILLAEQLSHGNILTTDKNDFSVYRWNRVHPFHILL